MKLLLEKWYPTMLAGAAAIVYLAIPALRQHKLPESVSALMAAMVSIGGISIGFLAAAKSILISIDDKEIVTRLKRTPHYRHLLKYLRMGIRWSFLLTFLSAAALLVELKGNSPWTIWHAVGFSCWIFAAVGATFSYHRVVSIFYMILDGNAC